MVLASSTSRDGSAASVVAVEAHQRERIVGIVDRRLDERLGALAHQAGVGAEDQHDRPRRIGPRDEGIDVGGFERDHAIGLPAADREKRAAADAHVPATK